MRRICKYCGTEYDGAPGSSACPECAARVKRSVVRTRVCRQCGTQFPGGPRAFYCPSCRAMRQVEADRRYRESGAHRPLGSIDRCSVCGRDYVVKSSRQNYCPLCADEAVRKIDRMQALAWSKDNLPPDKRRIERQACAAKIQCVVCGATFVPRSPAVTCSAACGEILAKRKAAEYEKMNRKQRNMQRRDRRKKKATEPKNQEDTP